MCLSVTEVVNLIGVVLFGNHCECGSYPFDRIFAALLEAATEPRAGNLTLPALVVAVTA